MKFFNSRSLIPTVLFRYLSLWLSLILSLLAISCNNNSEIPVTEVPFFNNKEFNIVIKRWRVLGPIYRDTSNKRTNELINIDDNSLYHYWNVLEDDLNEENFHSFNKDNATKNSKNIRNIRNVSFEISNDYSPLDKVLGSNLPGDSYLGTILNSPVEQDVVFFERATNGRKIWLNNKLILNERKGHNHFCKGHLKKGKNFLKVKVSDLYGFWFLHLNVFSKEYYVNQFYLNKIYSNFITSPIVQKGNLCISLDPDFLNARKSSNIQIFDSFNTKVLDTKVSAGSKWMIPVNQLKEGAYVCKLVIDQTHLEQEFVIGEPKKIYRKLLNKYDHALAGDKLNINIKALINRYSLVDSTFKKDKDTISYQKKIPFLIHEFERTLFNSAQKVNSKGYNEKGWHLRGYHSRVDNSIQYYMVYVPKSYTPKQPNSLIVSMPYIGSVKHPFYGSTHVANLARNEMLGRLADIYNTIILIPSSRILELYNFNPIVSTETFDAMAEIKNDYNINNKQIYLYGSCSGGVFAAVIANRFPGVFAAIGLEGPEFGYTISEEYPSEWLESNNIFNYTENYSGVPIHILHSKNDKKADYDLAVDFAEKCNENGVNIKIDTIDNAHKSQRINLHHDDILMPKMFEFFKGKVLNQPKHLKFSTSQLKYNKAYWITIHDICSPGKASLEGKVKAGNIIDITSKNTCAFSFNFRLIPGLSREKKIKIVVNKKVMFDNYIHNDTLLIRIKDQQKGKYSKSPLLEGPTNDVFSSSFLLVKGTLGITKDQLKYASAANAFYSNWKSFYLVEPRLKNDVNISHADMVNNNLIIFGTDQTNSIVKKIAKFLPVEINKQYIKIQGRTYYGNDLRYIITYPNPLNPNKYILLVGSNSGEFSAEQISDLSIKGWFDYEIWDNSEQIGKGYFTKNWL